jgi:hypothetical protein
VHLAQEAAGLARVLFGDESGFTENPALTQAWAPKGEPHAHEMKTGTHARRNGISCSDFNLKPVSMWFKAGRLGGADFRAWGSGATQALFPDWQSKGSHVHFVSPYSPELNCIEMLRRKMKHLRPFRLLEIKELQKFLRNALRHQYRKS